VLGAAVGSALKAVRLDVQGGTADALYLLVGWAGLLVLPALRRSLSSAQQALLLAGGVLYTAGAGVLVQRWPDPVPAVFGYHEVGHLVMACGTALHYLLDLSVLAQS
jgi:hemolysin III